MLRLLGYCCFFIIIFGSGKTDAQHRTALDELFHPNTEVKTLTYTPENKVYIQLVEASVEQLLLHYLSLSTGADWQLVFPSDMEAKAWLQGLKKSGKPPVFMLDLYHFKSKVNYNLTIGPNSGTRQSKAQSIITIYSTRRSFAERRGG